MSSDSEDRVRTAVVIVHGMGEQLPLDTLNRFINTALPKIDGERKYYSRPERVTSSYEARRMLAFAIKPAVGGGYGQTEFFEYHWSYLMTGNRLDDLFPILRRMLLRSPRRVPAGLLVAWVLAWLLIIAVVGAAVWIYFGTPPEDRSFKTLVLAAVPVAVLWVVKLLLGRLADAVTRSFVDVVRYLDRSPRSYEVRRAIRGGMVDLLRGLHDKGRYTRIVVVAHSLGAYIAYDGISYLWPQMSNLHGGPIRPRIDSQPLKGLEDLQNAANDLNEATGDISGERTDFRNRQFELWRQLRLQGNPWLITDFISLGAPMYFADDLYTKNRAEFDTLVDRAELPVCPPISATRTVEGTPPATVSYGFKNRGRTVLGHGTPFAVVRWTNMFFPAEQGFFGDWFGGLLQPLFGRGVLDIPITGNTPGRRMPALAHSRYFRYPDELGEDDVATLLRTHLDLDIDAQLEPLLRALTPLPETDEGGAVRRNG